MIKISLTSSAELPNEQTSNLPEERLSMAAEFAVNCAMLVSSTKDLPFCALYL